MTFDLQSAIMLDFCDHNTMYTYTRTRARLVAFLSGSLFSRTTRTWTRAS